MSLRSFRYFLVTAEEMHFSRAAQRLYITQQSLSTHIQKLEERYGVILFERRPTLKLTLAGEKMVEYAGRMLETEAMMNAEFADISEHKKGKLTVGIARARGQIFMPAIWERYHAHCPNISVVLVEALTVHLEEQLQDGKLDLYIGVNAPESANTSRISLGSERFHCIVSKSLLQHQLPHDWETFLHTYRTGVDLLALKDFPFVMLSRSNRLRTAVDRYFNSHQITPQVVFETSDHDIIFALSQSGSGVGIVSQMYLSGPLSQKGCGSDFYVLPIRSDLPLNHCALVYRSEHRLPRYTEVFMEIVQDVFQGHMEGIDRLLSGKIQ